MLGGAVGMRMCMHAHARMRTRGTLARARRREPSAREASPVARASQVPVKAAIAHNFGVFNKLYCAVPSASSITVSSQLAELWGECWRIRRGVMDASPASFCLFFVERLSYKSAIPTYTNLV